MRNMRQHHQPASEVLLMAKTLRNQKEVGLAIVLRKPQGTCMEKNFFKCNIKQTAVRSPSANDAYFEKYK